MRNAKVIIKKNFIEGKWQKRRVKNEVGHKLRKWVLKVSQDCRNWFSVSKRKSCAQVSSNWPKIEYVVAWGIGISELGTILLMWKLLWVCESSEVWPTKKTPNSKSILENCCIIKIARKLQRTLFLVYVHTYFTTIFFWTKVVWVYSHFKSDFFN